MTQNQLAYQKNKIAENEVAIKDRLANVQVSKDLKEYGPLVDEVTIKDWYPEQELSGYGRGYRSGEHLRSGITAVTQGVKNVADAFKSMLGSFASIF